MAGRMPARDYHVAFLPATVKQGAGRVPPKSRPRDRSRPAKKTVIRENLILPGRTLGLLRLRLRDSFRLRPSRLFALDGPPHHVLRFEKTALSAPLPVEAMPEGRKRHEPTPCARPPRRRSYTIERRYVSPEGKTAREILSRPRGPMASHILWVCCADRLRAQRRPDLKQQFRTIAATKAYSY